MSQIHLRASKIAYILTSEALIELETGFDSESHCARTARGESSVRLQ